jgi:hypothetical protein
LCKGSVANHATSYVYKIYSLLIILQYRALTRAACLFPQLPSWKSLERWRDRHCLILLCTIPHPPSIPYTETITVLPFNSILLHN